MTTKPLPTETYIKFNLKYLTLTGLWNPYDDYRKWFYHIYCAMIAFAVVIVRILGYMTRASTLHQDFLQFTLCWFLVFAFICSCLKNLNILWHQSEIKFIETTLAWELTLPCSEEDALYRTKLVSKIIKRSKLFTIIWTLDAFVCGMCYYFECFDENNRTVDNLIIGYTCLRRFVETWNFWILLGADYLMFMAVTASLLANDCLVMCFMFHISTQLKILNFRLRKCDRAQIYMDKSVSSPHQELIYCIQHYQHIVRMVNVMQKVHALVLFPQFIASVGMTSLTAIHLFVTKTVTINDPIPAGQVMLGLVSILFQLVGYCWGGNTIIAESDLISSATYKSKWYKTDKEFRTNMMIFTAMAQNPLTLSAYGIFELSLVTLKNVLVKSYSAMALVKRANE